MFGGQVVTGGSIPGKSLLEDVWIESLSGADVITNFMCPVWVECGRLRVAHRAHVKAHNLAL